MRRLTFTLPDALDVKLPYEGARRGSTIADITREAIEAHLGGDVRHPLIAAKTQRSGSHDTARRIEAIIRWASR